MARKNIFHKFVVKTFFVSPNIFSESGYQLHARKEIFPVYFSLLSCYKGKGIDYKLTSDEK